MTKQASHTNTSSASNLRLMPEIGSVNTADLGLAERLAGTVSEQLEAFAAQMCQGLLAAAIGYATCTTPLGPCTKATADRPLLASAGDQAGPGGATVITGPAGDHWLVYHAWTPQAIGYANGGARSLHFASLTWPNNQPIIIRRS